MTFRRHTESKEWNQDWNSGIQIGSRAPSLNHITNLEKLFQTKKYQVKLENFL